MKIVAKIKIKTQICLNCKFTYLQSIHPFSDLYCRRGRDVGNTHAQRAQFPGSATLVLLTLS